MSSNIEYKGARFYKCALQVNPFSYARYRGETQQDEATYNQQILERCQENKIEVVGLADHGTVENSEGLRAFLTENRIIVFPGFEIASSENIHMVCLYPENTEKSVLGGYLAQLMGENFSKLTNEPTHPSSFSCEEIAKMVLKEQKGFWFSAHITGNKGLLRLSRAGDNYVQLWKKEDLVIAGQIPGSIDSLGENYKQIIKNKNPDYKREKPIVVINAKDIAKPGDLQSDSAFCLIKMTEPSMESFHNAFYDPESRIRSNQEEKEPNHTRFRAIKLEGGLYGQCELNLSNHLNVIIGGHGTGKSTLIESLRYTLGKVPTQNLRKIYEDLCKNNLSDARTSIDICSYAQGQNKYKIRRRYGEPPEVCGENGEISALGVHDILPDVEIYSQSEILEIAKDENAQIELLSRFLPDQHNQEEDILEIQHRLRKNRENLATASEEKDKLESHQNQIPQLNEQIKQFEKSGIEKKLKNIGLHENENSLIQKSQQEIKMAMNWLNEYNRLFDLNFFSDEHLKQLPNVQLLNKIETSLKNLKDTYHKFYIELKRKTEKCREEVISQVRQWQQIKTQLNDELNVMINELPDQGGKSGQQIAREYRELQRKLAVIAGQGNTFKHSKRLVEELEKERKKMLSDYSDKSFSRSKELRKTISDLNAGSLKGRLKIEFLPAGDKSKLKEFLVSLPGIGEKKIEWIEKADTIFPISLAQEIKEKNKDKLLEEYSRYGLTDGIAERLVSMEEPKRLELEEVEMRDSIAIKLNVRHAQEDNADFRAIDNLSTGQKCIAILNILLLNNKDPLIMDQPEDNLDNAFIADRIVEDLRAQKNHRQFIFATHNANIPVFGDAELIVVLKIKENRAVIDEIGSIDKSTVQKAAAQILEGGEAAFTMRKQKYGF